ncbi:ABC transporter substrate-binding protein [Cohnella zeiphila]|uniref:Sugar ABC transporter substrate-binding protein n=1 Tax=Cohnella zeiphila TaxID=2761120 RepID=A0A7X0VXA4_9BACL|nr:sugar ABC transporter substrate-binding protein [Cohnella zeiphila]MBB6733821.1 sugar ABC transporter substrate-binding protein [Cohnella zeiphila]
MNGKAGWLLSTIFVIGFVLAGCGGSNGNEGGASGGSSDAAPSASESGTEGSSGSPSSDDHAPVTLKYTFWGSPNEKKIQENAIKGFMKKYPWITVNTQHIPDDYVTKLTTMAAGNQLPDVGLLQGDQTLKWAEEGRIYNLMDFLNDDPDIQLSDILENTQYWWADGKLAGINGALEAMAIFYNKDVFQQLNVPLPPTKAEEAYNWDDFVKTAQQLTIDQKGRNALDPDFDPKQIKQYGVMLPTGLYMTAVYANGGQLVNEDGTKFMLAEPPAAEAIQRWADLINKYHVAPSPAQQKNIPGGATGLQTKKVAMTIDGQWSLADLGVSKMNFGIGVLPKMQKEVTMTLGDPIVIFQGTKHPKEAWELVKWMMNPDSTLELQSSGLWMPVLKKWYQEPDLVAKWAEGNSAHPEGYEDAVMNNAFENGMQQPIYYVRDLPDLNAIIDPALDNVWSGKTSAQEALDGIKAKAQAALKGVYTKPQ